MKQRIARMARHTPRQLKLSLSALLFALASAQAQAPLDIRVALVIGNGAYEGAAALANPTNDSRAMSETLRQLGFSVVELRDGNRAQMVDAIARVRESLKAKQGVGMLYYAGHGLQLDWHNYMVPVDARLSSASEVAAQTIDIDSVIDAFKGAGNRMNILVLDACRDNPFSSKASGKGLAQLDAPPGTFLAYATAPGNVAEDGDDKTGNGLYTQYLLQELRRPIAKIEDVFKRVRLNVRKQSQGRQIPWESTSLEDDFYFNDGVRLFAKAEDLERMAAEARKREQNLQQQATQARERELQAARELEKERLRLLEAQRAAEEQARQVELQRLQRAAAEAARLQAEETARREAEEQARRTADLKKQEELRLAAQAQQERLAREQTQRQAQEEQARRLAEQQAREQALLVAQARERERQLALAQQQERERADQAARELESARRAEEARLQSIEAARLQLEQTRMAAKLSKEEAREQAFNLEKADWDKIKGSKNADDFFAFLQKYPNGMISQQATFALEQLAKSRIVAQPDRNGIVQVAGEKRFRLGDRFEMVRTDNYSKQVIGHMVSRVTKIENDLVYLNDGDAIMTLDGGLMHNKLGGSFDPPRVDQPGDEMAVGKKWTARTIQVDPTGRSGWREDNVKIVALEDVTVPAGTFKAFKFVMNSIRHSGERVTLTYWAQPGWGLSIKTIREIRPPRGAPTLETIELVSRSRGQG